MPAALHHPREPERLAQLRGYEILDTERETEFDEIVKLAAALCDLPISVINLIDSERQWFKAEIGLGVRETPIDTSLCAHAILESDFLEIPDTLADCRTADNPLCAGERGLRFYAGALLTGVDNLPLGTLCVLGYERRELTPLQRDALRVLARQVMTRLDLRKSLAEADVLRREADHRVKNSLQSLLSYIRLAGRGARQAETSDALRLVSARVGSVVRIHEMLHRQDGPQAVDLGAYLTELGAQLQSFAPQGVRLSVVAPSVFVRPRQAVPVGTLVNEMVANAFKHAFHGQTSGNVTIEALAINGGHSLRISCVDDGAGVAAIGSPGQEGLGARIISLLVAELDAVITQTALTSGYGVAFEFRLE